MVFTYDIFVLRRFRNSFLLRPFLRIDRATLLVLIGPKVECALLSLYRLQILPTIFIVDSKKLSEMYGRVGNLKAGKAIRRAWINRLRSWLGSSRLNLSTSRKQVVFKNLAACRREFGRVIGAWPCIFANHISFGQAIRSACRICLRLLSRRALPLFDLRKLPANLRARAMGGIAFGARIKPFPERRLQSSGQEP
jgi:hypothetical protein